MKKSKQLRQFLINTMQKIEQGKMSASDGKNIVGCMNQINLSITAELKAQKMALDMGNKVVALGEMVVGCEDE